MDSDQPAPSLRPRVIALHGPDECGKDTIAKLIREQVEGSQMTIVTKAFADRVKIAIGACFGISEEKAVAWYDQLKDGRIEALHSISPSMLGLLTSLSGREFIENFAESHKTLFGEDFWAKQVLPEEREFFLYKWVLPGNPVGLLDIPAHRIPDFALITDLRYEIEHDLLEGLGGEVWGVVGRGVRGNAHEIPPKYVIDNSGDIDALRPQIRILLASP